MTIINSPDSAERNHVILLKGKSVTGSGIEPTPPGSQASPPPQQKHCLPCLKFFHLVPGEAEIVPPWEMVSENTGKQIYSLGRETVAGLPLTALHSKLYLLQLCGQNTGGGPAMSFRDKG